MINAESGKGDKGRQIEEQVREGREIGNAGESYGFSVERETLMDGVV